MKRFSTKMCNERKKMPENLEISEIVRIFATSNVCIDYAAECGEQALIDTTPFESHLRVAFIFHIFYEIFYGTEY